MDVTSSDAQMFRLHRARCVSVLVDEPQQRWRKYSDPLIVNNNTQTTLLKYSVTSTIPAFDILLQ